jgi:nucleotide-binding universal stress UspA family protein
MNTKRQTTDGVPRISRVLVATDFSPQASNALEWARSIAGAFGAKLVLLHVIDVSSLAKTGAGSAHVRKSENSPIPAGGCITRLPIPCASVTNSKFYLRSSALGPGARRAGQWAKIPSIGGLPRGITSTRWFTRCL